MRDFREIAEDVLRRTWRRTSTITRRSRCLEVRFYVDGVRKSVLCTVQQCVGAMPDNATDVTWYIFRYDGRTSPLLSAQCYETVTDAMRALADKVIDSITVEWEE
jgi:hypothetical protein